MVQSTRWGAERDEPGSHRDAAGTATASQSLLELRAIFENAAIAILFTRGRRIRRCNQRAAEMFGYASPDALVNQPALAIHKDAASYEAMVARADPLLTRGEPFHADWEFRRADGSALVCNLYGQAVDPSNPDEGAVWVIEDVTETRRMERELRERQEILDTVMEYMDQGISIVDADLVALAGNRRLRELLDFPEWLCQPGRHFSEFIRYNAERGDYGPGDVEAQVRERVALAQGFEPHEFRRERPDGTVLEIRGRPIPGGGFVTVYTDVTERARAEERAQYLATHDSLTDLPNRELFSRLLADALAGARADGSSFALLFIDLDRFKFINDSLGHEAGDRLLTVMAERFRATATPGDVVARLGGDEFVVLTRSLEGRAEAAERARAFTGAALEPVVVGERECRVTASIGICLFPEDADDERALMTNADIAMYRAKEEGKNTHQFYSQSFRHRSFDPMALEADLNRALERDEFFLVYQPRVEVASGRITGVEALLRWAHPEYGELPPARFIPVAEETGLIVPIGRWVLRTACVQARAWTDAALTPVRMAVNLSPRQFRDGDLLGDLDTALEASGLPAQRLELEVTESAIMFDMARAVLKLKAIQARGMHLSIDDFGTGYSSLAHIKHFPIDTLKIDRSFIRDLHSDAEDRAIARAIISMGSTLGLRVVAEGVENHEQQALLHEYGCQEMQGFYLGRPMPAAAFEALLRDGPAVRG